MLLGFLIWIGLVFPRFAAAAEVYDIPLKGDGKSSAFWTVDYRLKLISFEIHVPLPPTSWFAVGFSDYGEATSADLCVFWTDWRKRSHLQDVTTDLGGRVVVDESQDCTDFRFTRKNGLVVFTFKRKFDTCDPKDYVIEDGTTHVVWAEGKGPLYRLDGVNVLVGGCSGFQRTQLLKNQYAHEVHPPDTWELEVLADRVNVPAIETLYWCHVHKLPSLLYVKHHIVQYEPAIQKGNEHLVHHMEVFHCEAPPNEALPLYAGPCFGENRPNATKVCKRVIAAWAMGAKAFSYPQEAGLPIGGPQFNKFVMLEVHYNNPELHKGMVDSSGVKFYLTPTLRKFDGGVMELGLEYTDKMAIPSRQHDFQLSGYCITECTAVSLPEEGIIVFGSQLHTHLTGVQVYTKHVRNGVELPEMNRDNHYSTHFQEIRRLKRPVRIFPGDALITTCTYRTEDRQNVTLGGFSITDEMCVNYVHYYPKTDLEVCKSSVSYGNLHSYFDYLHKFENLYTSSKKPISENYKAIEWTPLRVQVLNDLYTQGTLSMQCNQSSGDRFPGNWEGLSSTKIMKPLILEPRCGRK